MARRPSPPCARGLRGNVSCVLYDASFGWRICWGCQRQSQSKETIPVQPRRTDQFYDFVKKKQQLRPPALRGAWPGPRPLLQLSLSACPFGDTGHVLGSVGGTDTNDDEMLQMKNKSEPVHEKAFLALMVVGVFICFMLF